MVSLAARQNPIKSEHNVLKGFLQVIFKLDLVNLLMEMLVLLDINVTKAYIDEM